MRLFRILISSARGDIIDMLKTVISEKEGVKNNNLLNALEILPTF